MTYFENKVVVLTGASTGLGKDLVRSLALEGAKIVFSSRRLELLEANKAELLKLYPQLTSEQLSCFACDVTDADQVESMVRFAQQQYGRIDILINNAAIATKFQLFQEHTLQEISDVIDVNLKGPMYCIQAILPIMVNQGIGDIMNINSVAGKKNYPYCSIYGATKVGLDALTQMVAEEQRPNNIRVMGVYPGRIDTPIWDSLEPGVEQDKGKMLTTENVTESILFALKQPRHIEMREIMILPAHCD